MSDETILQIFHTEGCGHCDYQREILSRWQPDGVTLQFVDCDKNPKMDKAAGIEATPTLIVLRNGKEVRRHEGVAQPPMILALLAQI